MITEQIPDSVKLASVTTPSIMTLWGIPVEQWMYVASAIVSVMFVIEKAPIVVRNIKTFIRWAKSVKSKIGSKARRGE